MVNPWRRMASTTTTVPPTTEGSNNNDTSSTYMYYGDAFVIPMSIILVIFIIMAIGGNVMVILTIVRHRGMRTRTNMFIVNLAVADILVAILNMPLSVSTLSKGDWVLSDGMCKFNGFTMALLLICSIHTLMYISIHKYISITKPFSRAMNPRRIRMMIGAAWVWSFICAMGPLVGWNKIVYKKGASQCGPSLPDDLADYTHSVVITTTNYFIPLAVMTFCYWHIFREIHDHMKRIRETSNINLSDSVSQQKKISITLFLVLTCFFLCWTPFVAYSSTVAIMKDKTKMPIIVNPIVYWCGYFNSVCNPIIYAFRSPSFRQGYKEIMCGTYQGPLVSGGNSVRMASLRSRSQRSPSSVTGKLNFSLRKYSTQKHEISENKDRSKKRFLSQTSWLSLPCFPINTKRINNHSSITEKQVQESGCVQDMPTDDEVNKLNGFCMPPFNKHNRLSSVCETNVMSKSCPSLQEAEKCELSQPRRLSCELQDETSSKETVTDCPPVGFVTSTNAEILVYNESVL